MILCRLRVAGRFGRISTFDGGHEISIVLILQAITVLLARFWARPDEPAL
jgi:hypothetical protein